MTDQNNAAQAVQESERNAAVEEYFGHRTWIKPTASNFRLFEAGFDRAYALLSKLRADGVQASAPVADERAAFEAWANNDTSESANLPLPRNRLGDYEDERADGAWHGWQAHARRAALASAPVAEPMPAFYINPSTIDPKTGRIGDNVKSALTWSNTKHHGWQVPVFLSPPQASAPVADERAAISNEIGFEFTPGELQTCNADDLLRLYRAGRRAALASAPVAGAAHMPPGYRVKAVDGHAYRITPPTGSDWVAHSDTPAGDLIAALLAAPQASEAVRNQALDDAEEAVVTLYESDEPVYLPDIALAILALKAQPDKDDGDCAKGADKRLHGLVEEAISWLETGGGRADSLCADLRKAMAAQKQEK